MSTHLDNQPAASVVEIHGHLAEPETPALEPVVPRLRLARRLGTQPHGHAEDLVVSALLLGNVEDGVPHAPSHPDGEGCVISVGIELHTHTHVRPNIQKRETSHREYGYGALPTLGR